MFLSAQGMRLRRTKTSFLALDISFNGTVPAEATYVAASNQTHIDINRVIQSSGVPFDYENTILQGLLYEETLTNLVIRSEEADNAAHTPTGVVITPDDIAGLDNTLTGDLVHEDTSNGIHQVEVTASVSTGTKYTAYAFLKAEIRTKGHIRFDAATLPAAVQVEFDLIAGSPSTVTGIADATQMILIADGWYLCSATVTTNATETMRMRWRPAVDSGSSYQGEGGKGIYMWGFGLVADDKPGSYIKTVASTVTRTAPTLTIAIANDTYVVFVETPNGTFEATSVTTSGGTGYAFDWADFTGAGSERHIRRLRFFTEDPGINPPPSGSPPNFEGLGLRSAAQTNGILSGIPPNGFWTDIAGESRARGALVLIHWFNIEDQTPDVYDFSVIQSSIDRAILDNLDWLCFELRLWSFGVPSGNPATQGLASYILQDPTTYGGLNVGTGGLARKIQGGANRYVTRMWDPNVMTRAIKLYEAILDYVADIPIVYGIFSNETTVGAIVFDGMIDTNDYTSSGMLAQWQRLISAGVTKAGNNTRYIQVANFIKQQPNSGSSSDVDIETLYDFIVDNHPTCGASFPDPRTPFVGLTGAFRFKWHELIVDGSTANPGKSLEIFPLGEAGADAFSELGTGPDQRILISDETGGGGTQRSLEDMTDLIITRMASHAWPVVRSTPSGQLGWQDVADIIDNPGLASGKPALYQAWAEKANS